MKPTKKTFYYAIPLVLIAAVFYFYHNWIFQKLTNLALSAVNSSYDARVSQMDIKFSEGKINCHFKLTNSDTNQEVLNIGQAYVDLNQSGFALKISARIEDIDLMIRPDLLSRLIKPSEKATYKFPNIPFIKLGKFAASDIDLNIVKPDLSFSINKLLIDFENGSGKVKSIQGNYKTDELKFLDIESVWLRFSPESPLASNTLSVSVLSPEVKLTHEFLNTLKDLAPKPVSSDKEQAPSMITSLLKEITLKDSRFIFEGKQNILAKVTDLNLNFEMGHSEIKDVALILPQQNDFTFFKTRVINLRFNPKFFTADQNAQLAVKVSPLEIKISSALLATLKDLPKVSEKEDDASGRFRHIDQISSIGIRDFSIHLKEKGISAKIEKIHISPHKGKAALKKISASLRSSSKYFLNMDQFVVSFDPDQLSSSQKPRLKLAVIELNLDISKNILKKLRKKIPQAGPQASPELPVNIERILVGNSQISFINYSGIGEQKRLTIQDIFGSFTHITLRAGTPFAKYNFNATFEGATKLMISGKMDLADVPVQWSANWKLFDFQMEKLDPEMRTRLPLSFKEGTLNLYGEAIKRENNIVGYIKPILKDSDTNWLLENDQKNTVATIIPFRVANGQLITNNSKALWRAVEHGFLENNLVEPGIAKRYQLKQAQEETPK